MFNSLQLAERASDDDDHGHGFEEEHELALPPRDPKTRADDKGATRTRNLRQKVSKTKESKEQARPSKKALLNNVQTSSSFY